jgi:hypothetical protein
MPPKGVAKTQGAFEIDRPARAPISHGGSTDCRAHGGGGEPASAALADSQTDAVDGDALALLQVVVAARNTELPPGFGGCHALDCSDIVNESSEH